MRKSLTETADSYELLSLKTVRDEASEFFKGYRGIPESKLTDNEKVTDYLKKLLPWLDEKIVCVPDLTKAPNLAFKYLAHLDRVTGIAAWNLSLSAELKQLAETGGVSSEKLLNIFLQENPVIETKDGHKIPITNLEGWDRFTFFILHLCFLIKIYYRIHQRAPRSPVAGIPQGMLEELIAKEIWVTANALTIYCIVRELMWSDIHVMSDLPTEKKLKQYKNSYIFVKKEPALLFYIDNRGSSTSLSVDQQKFKQIKLGDIKESASLREQIPQGTVSQEILDALSSIIRLNQKHSQFVDDDSLLKKWIHRFLQSAAHQLKEMDTGDEVCFPCGFDGHAMCLSFYHDNRGDHSVLLRVDNVGDKTPFEQITPDGKEVTLKPLTQTTIEELDEKLSLYVLRVCLATREQRDEGADKIYNDGERHIKLAPAKIKGLFFPRIPRQTTGHCAVESFSIGVRCRFYALSENHDYLFLFNWLWEQERHFIIDASGVSDPFLDRAHKRRDEIKQKYPSDPHQEEYDELLQEILKCGAKRAESFGVDRVNKSYYLAPKVKMQSSQSMMPGLGMQPVPLKEKVLTFLSAKRVVGLLLGDAGSGKTLFALWLEQYLRNNFYEHGILPVYISLKKYSGDKAKGCIQGALRNEYGITEQNITNLKNGLGRQQRILFILDGYDDLGLGIKIDLHKENGLDEWSYAQIWVTCRAEQFSSDEECKSCFTPLVKGELQPSGLSIDYLAPFSEANVAEYLTRYLREDFKKTGADSKSADEGYLQLNRQVIQGYLQNSPKLTEMLSNPLMLFLFLQIFPLVRTSTGLIRHEVTRTSIYAHYMEDWFNKIKVRLQECLPKEQQDADLKATYNRLVQDFAFECYRQGSLVIKFKPKLPAGIQARRNRMLGISMPAELTIWEKFFDDPSLPGGRAILSTFPIRRVDSDHFEFMHRSFYEYWITEFFLSELDEESRPLREASLCESLSMCSGVLESKGSTGSNWSVISDQGILEFFQEGLSLAHPRYQQRRDCLKDQVLKSKRKELDSKEARAAANGITILNAAGMPFSNIDFSEISIPGACLDLAIFDHTNLSKVQGPGASFHRAFLRDTCVTGANFSRAFFKPSGVVEVKLPSKADKFGLYSAWNAAVFLHKGNNRRNDKITLYDYDKKNLTAIELKGKVSRHFWEGNNTLATRYLLVLLDFCYSLSLYDIRESLYFPIISGQAVYDIRQDQYFYLNMDEEIVRAIVNENVGVVILITKRKKLIYHLDDIKQRKLLAPIILGGDCLDPNVVEFDLKNNLIFFYSNSNRMVVIYDTKERKLLKSILMVNNIKFIKNTDLVFLCQNNSGRMRIENGEGFIIRIYNSRTQDIIRTVESREPVDKVFFSEQLQLVFLHAQQGEIINVYSVGKERFIKPIVFNKKNKQILIGPSRGFVFIYAINDTEIFLYESKDEVSTSHPIPCKQEIRDVLSPPRGNLVFVLHENCMSIFDCELKEFSSETVPLTMHIDELIMADQGDYVLLYDSLAGFLVEGETLVYDVIKKTLHDTIKLRAYNNVVVMNATGELAFFCNDRADTNGNNRAFYVYDIINREVIVEEVFINNPVDSIIIDPDGHFVYFYNKYDGRQIGVFDIFSGYYTSINCDNPVARIIFSAKSHLPILLATRHCYIYDPIFRQVHLVQSLSDSIRECQLIPNTDTWLLVDEHSLSYCWDWRAVVSKPTRKKYPVSHSIPLHTARWLSSDILFSSCRDFNIFWKILDKELHYVGSFPNFIPARPDMLREPQRFAWMYYTLFCNEKNTDILREDSAPIAYFYDAQAKQKYQILCNEEHRQLETYSIEEAKVVHVSVFPKDFTYYFVYCTIMVSPNNRFIFFYFPYKPLVAVYDIKKREFSSLIDYKEDVENIAIDANSRLAFLQTDSAVHVYSLSKKKRISTIAPFKRDNLSSLDGSQTAVISSSGNRAFFYGGYKPGSNQVLIHVYRVSAKKPLSSISLTCNNLLSSSYRDNTYLLTTPKGMWLFIFGVTFDEVLVIKKSKPATPLSQCDEKKFSRVKTASLSPKGNLLFLGVNFLSEETSKFNKFHIVIYDIKNEKFISSPCPFDIRETYSYGQQHNGNSFTPNPMIVFNKEFAYFLGYQQVVRYHLIRKQWSPPIPIGMNGDYLLLFPNKPIQPNVLNSSLELKGDNSDTESIWLLVYGNEGAALYHFPTGKLFSLIRHVPVTTAEFSPDATSLTLGSDHHAVQLWDIADPERTPPCLRSCSDALSLYADGVLMDAATQLSPENKQVLQDHKADVFIDDDETDLGSDKSAISSTLKNRFFQQKTPARSQPSMPIPSRFKVEEKELKTLVTIGPESTCPLMLSITQQERLRGQERIRVITRALKQATLEQKRTVADLDRSHYHHQTIADGNCALNALALGLLYYKSIGKDLFTTHEKFRRIFAQAFNIDPLTFTPQVFSNLVDALVSRNLNLTHPLIKHILSILTNVFPVRLGLESNQLLQKMNLLCNKAIMKEAYECGNIKPEYQVHALRCLAERGELFQMAMAIALRGYCVENSNLTISFHQVIDSKEIVTTEVLQTSKNFGEYVGAIELEFLTGIFDIQVLEKQGEFGPIMSYGKGVQKICLYATTPGSNDCHYELVLPKTVSFLGGCLAMDLHAAPLTDFFKVSLPRKFANKDGLGLYPDAPTGFVHT